MIYNSEIVNSQHITQHIHLEILWCYLFYSPFKRKYNAK
jgi:hypothetical protein